LPQGAGGVAFCLVVPLTFPAMNVPLLQCKASAAQEEEAFEDVPGELPLLAGWGCGDVGVTFVAACVRVCVCVCV
jgi:hypothetical protein